MNTCIILIRHAESRKNLNDIHGGDGDVLSQNGIRQAMNLEKRFKDWGVNKDNSVISFSDSIQTRQTADIIIGLMGLPVLEIPDFRPIYMGVVHGLSNFEVKQRYPDVYKALDKWRNKEIEINKLRIPNMEDPYAFFDRGRAILSSFNQRKNYIIFTTTSLYILLASILLGLSPDEGGGYKHMNINNAAVSFFENENDKWVLNTEKTDVPDVLNISTSS